MTARLCACGCGASMDGFRSNRRYFNESCKQRVRPVLDAESVLMRTILRYDPCSYCGAPKDYFRREMSIDHIVPVAAGGESTWENMTAACLRCNSGKCDESLLAFLNRGGVRV